MVEFRTTRLLGGAKKVALKIEMRVKFGLECGQLSGDGLMRTLQYL